jgi:hypothetical protein
MCETISLSVSWYELRCLKSCHVRIFRLRRREEIVEVGRDIFGREREERNSVDVEKLIER